MTDTQHDGLHPVPDPAAWVDQHGDCLFRYAIHRVGDQAVAEDLVQETFLAAFKDMAKFAGRSAERTWLHGILNHKIIDYLRRMERERATNAANSFMGDELFDTSGWWQTKPGDWPADPHDVLERKEFWAAFRHCLENLPQRLRTVFSLREMDELATNDVCEILNVTPGNLSVLLYRARMGLRRCLELNWFGTGGEE